MFVQRTVKEIAQAPDDMSHINPRNLDALRSIPALVLLGEPGAGKSSAFEEEAKACKGICIPVVEFINTEPMNEWAEHTLFLDGLDENRTTGTNQQTILYQIRQQLRKLGNPNFRISCRAADWYGTTDKEAITGASPDGQLPVFALEPLTINNIKAILEHKHNRHDADVFIAQARSHGLHPLLANPQTLELIVKALAGKSWPTNREETYRFACETLAQEGNKRHRDQHRLQQRSSQQLLDASGQLFATLLLANSSGIALDSAAENQRFACIDKFQPKNILAAKEALHSRLFMPAPQHEERLIPTHRSVAEYLGASWLGKQIDTEGLPQQRILNLMCGTDGKAVAGLRGLYGWLALTSMNARPELIRNDPLTITLYADTHPMPLEDKKLILHEIHKTIKNNPAILWELRQIDTLCHLFDPGLHDTFLEALQNPNRDNTTQAYVVFILKILKPAASRTKLADALRNLATDPSRWDGIRRHALEAWLNAGIQDNTAIELLNKLTQGNISDQRNELAGILLNTIFPDKLSGSEALSHLHRTDTTISGMYQYFWGYVFPEKVPEKDLPAVLDKLSRNPDLKRQDRVASHLLNMLEKLVARAVQTHGDTVSNDTLFAWLHLLTDDNGYKPLKPAFHQERAQWFKNRPERYFGLLQLCYERSQDQPSPADALYANTQILRRIPEPPNLGLWHLQQLDHTQNEILINEHISEAVRSLWSQEQEGLNIDMLFTWAGNDTVRLQYLTSHLACKIPSWQQKARTQRNQQHDNASFLATQLADIETCTAPQSLMGELARIWTNRYSDIKGATPLDRFRNYCNNHKDVYQATLNGMKACISRKDLPTPGQIINLSIQHRTYLISEACMLGMELVWNENPDAIDHLSNEILQTMICFRLADGTGDIPDWFQHLVTSKAELVANTLIAVASAQLKARKTVIDGIHELGSNPSWKNIAHIATPALLQRFPTRTKASQLNQLDTLLKSALAYNLPELESIITHKLTLKTLEPGQKIYFLLAGTLLDPKRYEQQLWDVAGKTWQRIRHIARFTSQGFNELQKDLALSPKTLGKLIELQAPFAELEWPLGGGTLTEAMELGDQVKSLLSQLAAHGTQESLAEINRLLEKPELRKLSQHLHLSKHTAIENIRENSYNAPDLTDVATILNNEAPTGPKDLLAIVLDQLQSIASDIRTSNSDLYRHFWTEEKDTNKHKSENSCRDALLEMLRNRLRPKGIDCNPEFDYVSDKRADIHISYQDLAAIPIEIKGQWHKDLWTAANTQLQTRYTTPGITNGHGIYLVLWTGGSQQPPPRDGGKKPQSPEELQQRLTTYISRQSSTQIEVVILDISWPP
ncbi:hypothetical protein Ptc2401_01356 [Prosthecochloris sp. CIB 2401]|nr:hypothetical protein Ptc2401_01356 [Prosthecochloris sp. CIB 2401]